MGSRAIACAIGHDDLKAIEARQMDPAGEGQTRTGKAVGMVVTLFWGALIVVSLISRAG